jgi:hypothetical protein
MTEVLVREQAAAQGDWFASFKLLEQIAEVLERLSPRPAGVIPMEGPAAEVVPVVVADVERAQTPLFLRDSDSTDMPFALEASKDSDGTGDGRSGIALRRRGGILLWQRGSILAEYCSGRGVAYWRGGAAYCCGGGEYCCDGA